MKRKIIVSTVCASLAAIAVFAYERTKCRYCGNSAYGRACNYAPNSIHRHGSGRSKCIWCGSKAVGRGCNYGPNSIHQR